MSGVDFAKTAGRMLLDATLEPSDVTHDAAAEAGAREGRSTSPTEEGPSRAAPSFILRLRMRDPTAEEQRAASFDATHPAPATAKRDEAKRGEAAPAAPTAVSSDGGGGRADPPKRIKTTPNNVAAAADGSEARSRPACTSPSSHRHPLAVTSAQARHPRAAATAASADAVRAAISRVERVLAAKRKVVMTQERHQTLTQYQERVNTVSAEMRAVGEKVTRLAGQLAAAEAAAAKLQEEWTRLQEEKDAHAGAAAELQEAQAEEAAARAEVRDEEWDLVFPTVL